MTGKKLGDHERPRLGNDFYQHPHLPQVHPVDPNDGIPRPAASFSMDDALAPPLAVETMVCMEDATQYVIRDGWGNVLLSVAPDRVRPYQDPDGGDGRMHYLAELNPEEIGQAQSPKIFMGGDGFWYRVQPVREQCSFYKRVMLDFEGQDDAKHVERSCTAQRTEGGEYVSLADTRVYACEHRAPRDFVSEQRLRRFDAARVAEAQKTEEEYDVAAKLAAMKENSGNG